MRFDVPELDVTTLDEVGFDGRPLRVEEECPRLWDERHASSASPWRMPRRRLYELPRPAPAAEKAKQAAILQKIIQENARALEILDREAPDLARHVRADALDIRGALLQLGQRRKRRQTPLDVYIAYIRARDERKP
jgi:hypothetical protein